MLRNLRNDYMVAEQFCEKYGIGYGDAVDKKSKYSVFFMDVDGDEIQCCLSINSGDLTDEHSINSDDIVLFIPLNERDFADEPYVNYDNVVLCIPLNERDLTTNVYNTLFEYCIEHNIITE